MINKFLTDIKIIKKAIGTKKLVIFAGAGISVDAGVPSWSKLIDEIKRNLDLPDYENDFLKHLKFILMRDKKKKYLKRGIYMMLLWLLEKNDNSIIPKVTELNLKS